MKYRGVRWLTAFFSRFSIGTANHVLIFYSGVVIVICAMLGSPAQAEGQEKEAIQATVYLPVVLRPDPIIYKIASNVPVTDVNIVKTGIGMAQTMLEKSYGGNIPSAILREYTVRMIADGKGVIFDDVGSAGCFANGADDPTKEFKYGFFVDVLHWCWHGHTALDNQKTGAHEFFHSWQQSIGGENLNALPMWLVEGTAEFAAYDTIATTGQLTLAEQRERYLLQGFQQATLDKPLQEQETYPSTHWPLYFFAGEKLAQLSPKGRLAFRKYFEDIGAGVSPDNAFQQTFGITKAAFYQEFPAYVDQIRGGHDVLYRNTFNFAWTVPFTVSSAIKTVSWSDGKLYWGTHNATSRGEPIPLFSTVLTIPHSIEVSILVTATHQGGQGLLLADRQFNKQYVFLVDSSTQKYKLYSQDTLTPTILVDWTAAEAILPVGQSNRLKIEFQANTLAVHVNDTLLATTPINDINTGWVGVINFVEPAKSVTLYVDDFFMRKIE